jgi:uncharacterized radical SAM superfamily Fe-S cluster-containing enzyme
MASTNYGVCNTCRKRVPATHVIRDGEVYLVKDCPDCGITEALVSSHADIWQRKREICQYDPTEVLTCSIQCETCNHDHHPRMVFLDVTNRCNMNCPICIANIPGMGFEFHPPFSYFEKVLKACSEMEPRPLVQLFGGEPTVRDDIFEIIELGRSLGLDLRIVTNGLKLADEEYCKRICETKVHVLVGFDGNDAAIYEKLRKNPSAFEKKVKALENLEKYSRHKNTIMCCVARGINDTHMRGLIDMCHDSRSIKCLHLIPLTETWEEGEFETDASTTTEDVEQIINEGFPDEEVEFVPAGITENFRAAAGFFGEAPMKFGGVHPNCESGTYLLSDGERYHALSYYLKRPVSDLAEDMVACARRINPKLARLNPSRALHKLRGRTIVLRSLGGLLLKSLNFRRVFRGSPVLSVLRILWGSLRGRRLKDLLRAHTNVHDAMLMIVLPFEEYHSVESARLQHCFAGFVFEDPDDGQVKTIPVCVWGLYNRDLERRIAERYAAAAEPV